MQTGVCRSTTPILKRRAVNPDFTVSWRGRIGRDTGADVDTGVDGCSGRGAECLRRAIRKSVCCTLRVL